MHRHTEREEDRQMSNELTTQSGLVNYNPGQASLLEMRRDSARFPRLKAMPREQAIMGMSKIVSQAFLYKGQAADPTNIQFISSTLVQELLDDDTYGACYLSLAEIQVIVKRAVLGGTEMFGISVSSLYKIIMEYVKGEGHLYQKRLEDLSKQKREQALKSSAVNPMLDAYTGNFIKSHRTK